MSFYAPGLRLYNIGVGIFLNIGARHTLTIESITWELPGGGVVSIHTTGTFFSEGGYTQTINLRVCDGEHVSQQQLNVAARLLRGLSVATTATGMMINTEWPVHKTNVCGLITQLMSRLWDHCEPDARFVAAKVVRVREYLPESNDHSAEL
jgi:hypothetical protein